jgi:hypothetical protein
MYSAKVRETKLIIVAELILSIVPGQLSVREIRQTLVRARRLQVLPPSSRASSPPFGTRPSEDQVQYETVLGSAQIAQPTLEELAETLGLDWRADLFTISDPAGQSEVSTCLMET